VILNIPKPPRKDKIGKEHKLLPSKAGLNTLAQSQRTLLDYSKQVPTQNQTDANPLIVDLARKRQF
jgi:hypothetical protein